MVLVLIHSSSETALILVRFTEVLEPIPRTLGTKHTHTHTQFTNNSHVHSHHTDDAERTDWGKMWNYPQIISGDLEGQEDIVCYTCLVRVINTLGFCERSRDLVLINKRVTLFIKEWIVSISQFTYIFSLFLFLPSWQKC